MTADNLLEAGAALLAAWDETAVVHGDDSLAHLDFYLQKNLFSKAAVFTGARSADESGAWAELLAALRYSACTAMRFNAVPAEPDMETVEAMVEFLRNEQPDCVIALGGGSVMDAAKAAYVVYQSGLPLAECFGVNKISNAFPECEFRRIIAVPTTSGTGSELTQYSNIVNRAGQVKQLISDPVLVPEMALLCGRFTYSMPRSVTLATGCDALAHLLEGWLNVNADAGNEKINEAARIGVALLMKYLPVVLAEPDNKIARKGVQLASALGGMTIRHKSTGLPHLMSFSWFGRIEHGIAAARLLPASWRYYAESERVAQRTLEIGKVLGGDTADKVIGAYEKLLQHWQVPSLQSYPELDEELIKRTCISAGANRMKLELAPRPVPLADSAEILEMILRQAMEEN